MSSSERQTEAPPATPADGEPARRRGGRRPGGPPGRRDDVIREAADLFDARGYHQTSMEDIASAVGLRKPTLYHYFGSKDEILYWIHDEFIELLIGRHERRLSTTMSAEQQVLEIMGDILELMETHRGHVRVFFEHWRELSAPKREAIDEKRTRYERLVRESVQRGVDDGTFRGVDPQLAALAMFGMCNWAYQWYRSDGDLRTREIAYSFWSMLVHGITAPPG